MKKFITLSLSFMVLANISLRMPKATTDYNISDKTDAETTENITVVKAVNAKEDEGIRPKKLFIEKIDLEKEVTEMGLNSQGLQGVPDSNSQVSWFTGGVLPGQKGNAVLAGHNIWQDDKGAFYELKNMASGDKIKLTDQSGKEVIFRVETVNVYPTQDFPTREIYGQDDRARLNLITCHGDYNSQLQTYDKRLVVRAVLN